MTDNKTHEDLLLEQFFQPAREQIIEDHHFSHRVMSQLPDRSLRLSFLWTAFCVVLAVVLFVAFKLWRPIIIGIDGLLNTMVHEVHPIPFFITLGVLCSLALLETIRRLEMDGQSL